MKAIIVRTCFLLTFFIFNSSCSETSDGFSSLFPNSKVSNYFKSSESLTLEVYYEPGAEPFVGNIGSSGTPLWNIVEDNIEALFSYRSNAPIVVVPKALSSMNQLDTQSKDLWSPEDVIELYKKNHILVATKTTAVFYVYFLNGYSSSGSSTIAFSINTTPVIAVFKDVIKNSGGPVVQKFVEQSTIVHELGHAFGLVNNGIPLSSNHQDSEHGSHTTNSSCVMFWLNEGSSDLQAFVASYITTGDTVMWGPEVLADAEAFSD